MLEHKGFRKLAFTGSTEVGRNVALAAAQKLIPSTLELGESRLISSLRTVIGKWPWTACRWASSLTRARCAAGSRVFVQESIYDRFVKEAVKRFNQVKVGLPWEADTQMGSQINKGQMEKILQYIEIGKAEGAELLCGGEQLKSEGLKTAASLSPPLLGNVTNHMRVASGRNLRAGCLHPVQDRG